MCGRSCSAPRRCHDSVRANPGVSKNTTRGSLRSSRGALASTHRIQYGVLNTCSRAAWDRQRTDSPRLLCASLRVWVLTSGLAKEQHHFRPRAGSKIRRGRLARLSQLSDWKRAHMCTENHVCLGRIHGSQLREGANAGRATPRGQHAPTLSLHLPPSHHCLNGEVYRGNRHYNDVNEPQYHGIHVYGRVYVQIKHYVKNDLKYKHSVRCNADGSPPQSSQARRVGLHAHQRLHRLP